MAVWGAGSLRGLWRDLPAPPPGPLKAFLPPRVAHSRRLMSWEDTIFALATGDPPVVLLSGPPGCGKTSLLLSLARVLIESESADPAYLRLGPGADPDPGEIWAALCTRAGVPTPADLGAAGGVRVLLDADALSYYQAAHLARLLAPPPGVAVWIAVRQLAHAPFGYRPEDEAFESWSWAPPSWMSISLLLRSRKQAALLARLAEGEASWALRDPFLLGLLSRTFGKREHVPSQPGPLLDALAAEVAGSPGDRGRQVLVADLLPALASALEAEGVEEWPDHKFRHLAFEVARAARLPSRPQDFVASAVAAEVLVRRGAHVAFCHPAVRETFAAWDLTNRVTRSGTSPLLAAEHGAESRHGPAATTRELTKRIPAAGSGSALHHRSPQPPLHRLSDGMATRVVARMTQPQRLQELYDLLARQGRWAPLADGLAECRLPVAAGLRKQLLIACRGLLGGGDDPRETLRNPRAGWYEEPLAALASLGGAEAYDAVREGLAASLAAFAEGMAASGLGGATLVAPDWTDGEASILEDSPFQVSAYLERERGFTRAAARALRYLDGNRFVADIAEGRLPPPVVRALLWDTLAGDMRAILTGPAAQVGAALLDAEQARAWPTWILQTVPAPWGVAFLSSLGCLAGPAGDPVAYLGWPPHRSEGFINVIQGLWHESLAAVETTERKHAEAALEGLLEAFAATWNGAPEGTWDAIPGRPVGRLAHFFLSMLHRHVGERESLRASRGLNAALLASEPEGLIWHLSRLREVLRVDRVGFLSPRQARLLGVALRFIPIRDRRLAALFGRAATRTLSTAAVR